MTATSICKSAGLNSFMYFTKNIINIILIVAPILAIISFIFLFFKLTMDPDNKKLIKRLENVVKAMLFLFFIPLSVTIVMSLVGEKTDITKCYKNAQKPDVYAQYIKIESTDDNKKIIKSAEDYEDGTYKQLDFSCKSKYIKAQFSCDTIHIVERHMTDFNYYNFRSVIDSYGGFDRYMQKLGGYFKKYYGVQPKVTTVYEFQQVAEYVYGMMVMYGFDYYNGENGKYCKWGGSCQDMEKIRKGEFPKSGNNRAFYPGQLIHNEDGLSDRKNFDRLISPEGEINMTTCCNWTVDMVYYKAGIFGTGRTAVNSSASFTKMGLAKTNKLITNYEDIKPGDIVHWFERTVDPANPNTWGDWYHVSFVGEVDQKKRTWTTYEGGSAIMLRENHKSVYSMDKPNNKIAIVRVIDLK